MINLVEKLQAVSVTMQAIAVSIGGLIGVFATLAFFFLLIWLSDKFANRSHR